MAENSPVMTTEMLREDLRRISVFSDLPDDQLTWLAERMVDQRMEAGDVLARPGDPVRFMTVILEGDIEARRDGDPGPPLFVARAGQVTGALPYSRLTTFNATARAVVPTRLLQLHRDQFPELVQQFPLLAQRLVSIMSDRIRETAKLDVQREKMAALGKLSAGLAHELNNPAAAAQRASVGLREALETVREASLRLGRHSLSQEQRELIAAFEREAWQQKSVAVDPLGQSDREEAIVAWLERRQVPEAWKVAPVLAECGVDIPKLDALAAGVGDVALGDVLKRSSSLLTVFKLTVEIETSTRRISDLVRAIKEYSYMDQAPLQEVDVHHGIESTLTILGHWLKRGVTVVRDFDPSLPRVCAYGSELNQVWTNLIDNAISAMHGEGELRIRTARESECVLVEIGDNGPGIPKEIQPRIFEPFFTTKPVGEGTGLGLDTVYRIVTRHHGDIRVESKPGDTRFRVCLPVIQPRSV
jgi:signal transduction histidine kinase